MSEKKSNYIEIDSVESNQFFNVFGGGVDRKITRDNLFSQILNNDDLIPLSDWIESEIYPLYFPISSSGRRFISAITDNQGYDPLDPANVPSKWIEIEFLVPGSYQIYDWSDSTAYTGVEYVNRNSIMYKSVQAGTNKDPESEPNYWQSVSNLPTWGTTATYRQYQKAIGSDGQPYVSQQNGNLNHNPVGDDGTWWEPEWKQGNSKEVKIKSGGGTLDAYYENRITDGNTYTLPAANSVPSGAFIIISKSDAAVALSPTFQRAGSDTIGWRSGTDTSVIIDTPFDDCMCLTSNGTNQWSF